MRTRGFLIALEGLDGAGTTTQARAACTYLESRGVPVHLTREPSDNPVGQLIRQFLAGRHAIHDQQIDRDTMALLFAADRSDHLQREVIPRLAAGHVVISDRWLHSSLAYQTEGPPGLPGHYAPDFSWVVSINRRSVGPDLTIFLRVDPEIAARRRSLAGRSVEMLDDIQTQQRVSRAYETALDFCQRRGEQVEILDGAVSAEEVGARIARRLDELLQLR